jgi:hypothetical protein
MLASQYRQSQTDAPGDAAALSRAHPLDLPASPPAACHIPAHKTGSWVDLTAHHGFQISVVDVFSSCTEILTSHIRHRGFVAITSTGRVSRAQETKPGVCLACVVPSVYPPI